MSNERGASLSFTTLLAILFIGLKLTNYIDWSWLWVLSPIWIPIIIFIIVSIIIICFECIKYIN